MQQIDIFEERLREVSVLMSRGTLKEAEPLLKQLEKDVKYYLIGNNVVENDRLAGIQIAIYNNLACICER